MPALIIAQLTLREASRRKLLMAVAILTVVLVGFTAWGFQRLTSLPCGSRPCSPDTVRILAATLTILVTFMYSFIFSLGAVFMAAPSIAAEVESGVALAIMTRPIRRRDVVLGKWLGLATLVGGYTICTTALEFIAVSLIVNYSVPHPFGAIAYLVGECLIMLTLALLCSTRLAPMTGGIVALLLFGLGWFGGVAQAIGTALESDVVRNVGIASSIILPTDGLWRGALYNLEPVAMIAAFSESRTAAANPFFVVAPPAATYVLWAVAWGIVVLGATVFSFSRREL